MKTFYIFVILTGFVQATSGILFESGGKACLLEPDLCTCGRLSVTCDCNNGNMTTGNIFHNRREITIKNCQHLTVNQGSFKSGPLTVIFQDIQNLSLAAGSFEVGSNGRISITISNSKLSEVPTDMFNVSRARMQEPSQPSGIALVTHNLVFRVTSSEIGRIAPGAFARCTLRRLTITNTTLGHIDTGAIDNQVQDAISFINNTFVSLGIRAVAFLSSHTDTQLRLNGNRFQGNVPLFLEGNITGDVDINNNSFPRLETSPWRLRVEGDVLLQGNTFASLPRHGLDFTVHHRISLVENNIQRLGPEAFLLIVPQGKKTILFMDGNLIHQLEPMSLCLNAAFSPNSVVIKHVRFQQKCECNINATLSQALNIKNFTIQAINKNGVHEQWFKNGECILKSQDISHISIDQFLIHSCLPHKNAAKDSARVILIVTASILVTITLCVILAWRRMRSTASTISSSAAGYQSYTEPCPPTTAPSPWLAVQPENRTYQEVEIHVVFDKAQEISELDDAEINKEKDSDKTKDIKRTPSPLTRQSCPIMPMSKS